MALLAMIRTANPGSKRLPAFWGAPARIAPAGGPASGKDAEPPTSYASGSRGSAGARGDRSRPFRKPAPGA